MKPTTRSRSGQARDQVGRFTKGGSKVEETDPVLVKQQVAAAAQDQAVFLDQQISTEDNVVSAEENEVSEFDSDGGTIISSSANSDLGIEEEGKSVEGKDLCSNQLEEVEGLVAQQVFAEMPNSNPVAAGVNLGGVSSAGVFAGSLGRAVGDVQKAPWVNLFRDNRNLGKGILLKEKEVDGDLVILEEDDVDVVEEAWGYCLVGLFAGRFPGMAAVSKLREGWKVNCTHWRHRSGWLVFKFDSDEDRLKVLRGGPYFAYGSNLLLKRLPRCFRFEGEEVSMAPIWIQLPGLPLDCWNARALSKIVSKVGKPITTDKMTMTKERISFARVLVDVDASSEIVSDVEIRLPTGGVYHQPVIAEFTPKYCKRCLAFGHMVATCGKGLGGRQHKGFVAKKKNLSAGVGLAAPSAPSSAEVEVPLDGGAGRSGKGVVPDVGEFQEAEDDGCSVELECAEVGGSGVGAADPVATPMKVLPSTGVCRSGVGRSDEGLRLESVQEVDGFNSGLPAQRSSILLPTKVGLETVPSKGKPPLCPAVDLDSCAVGVPAAAIIGKQGMLSRQQGAAAVLQHPDVGDTRLEPVCPEVDMGDGEALWTAVGKKRKQKKKSGQPPFVVRSVPVEEGSSGQDRQQLTKGGYGREGVEGLSLSIERHATSTTVPKGKMKGIAPQSSK